MCLPIFTQNIALQKFIAASYALDCVDKTTSIILLFLTDTDTPFNFFFHRELRLDHDRLPQLGIATYRVDPVDQNQTNQGTS